MDSKTRNRNLFCRRRFLNLLPEPPAGARQGGISKFLHLRPYLIAIFTSLPIESSILFYLQTPERGLEQGADLCIIVTPSQIYVSSIS